MKNSKKNSPAEFFYDKSFTDYENKDVNVPNPFEKKFNSRIKYVWLLIFISSFLQILGANHIIPIYKPLFAFFNHDINTDWYVLLKMMLGTMGAIIFTMFTFVLNVFFWLYRIYKEDYQKLMFFDKTFNFCNRLFCKFF